MFLQELADGFSMLDHISKPGRNRGPDSSFFSLRMQGISRVLKTDEPFAFLSVCSEIHPIQLQELEKPEAIKKLTLNSRSTNPKNPYTHELRPTISLQKSLSRTTGLGKKCMCSASHKSFIFRASKESFPLKQEKRST